MSVTDLVRAWKDEDYRLGLDPALVPDHPAGDVAAETVITVAKAPLGTCDGDASCAFVCSFWS